MWVMTSGSTRPNFILKRPQIPQWNDLAQRSTISGNLVMNPKAIKQHSNQKMLIRNVLFFVGTKVSKNKTLIKSGAYGKYKVGCVFLAVEVSLYWPCVVLTKWPSEVAPHFMIPTFSDLRRSIDTLNYPVLIKRSKVRDPVTNSVLKLKKLVKVKFIPIDDTISDTKRQAAKARWKVSNPNRIKF